MTSKNCVLFFSLQGLGVGGEAGVKRRMVVVVGWGAMETTNQKQKKIGAVSLS